MNKWLFLAGVNGAAAVLMGAFAAHAMAARFPANAAGAVSTAAHYHLMHALALGVAALAARGKPGSWANIAALLFQIGIILFSGSLYLWALTAVRSFAYITPIGGTALVAGWIALAAAAWKMEKT